MEFSDKLCRKNDGGGGGEEMYRWESEGVWERIVGVWDKMKKKKRAKWEERRASRPKGRYFERNEWWGKIWLLFFFFNLTWAGALHCKSSSNWELCLLQSMWHGLNLVTFSYCLRKTTKPTLFCVFNLNHFACAALHPTKELFKSIPTLGTS